MGPKPLKEMEEQKEARELTFIIQHLKCKQLHTYLCNKKQKYTIALSKVNKNPHFFWSYTLEKIRNIQMVTLHNTRIDGFT